MEAPKADAGAVAVLPKESIPTSVPIVDAGAGLEPNPPKLDAAVGSGTGAPNSGAGADAGAGVPNFDAGVGLVGAELVDPKLTPAPKVRVQPAGAAVVAGPLLEAGAMSAPQVGTGASRCVAAKPPKVTSPLEADGAAGAVPTEPPNANGDNAVDGTSSGGSERLAVQPLEFLLVEGRGLHGRIAPDRGGRC